MGRGQYNKAWLSGGGERGDRGGGHGGGGGERGDRGGRHGGGERGERGSSAVYYGGYGGYGGYGYGSGWPYYGSSVYSAPSYGYSYPDSYGYALPAYDITDSGYVYNTGQYYSPNYGSQYALPYYGASSFPHWRSPRHFMNRQRRRLYSILGAE